MTKKKILLVTFVLVLIAVGVCVFHVSSTNKNKSSQQIVSLESTRKMPLRILTGMIYRHLIGYKMVCAEVGVELKKYPVYFSEKYKSGIQKTDEVWKKDGTTLEHVLIHFDPKLYVKIAADIKQELIDNERMAATFVLAHQAGVPVEEFKWTAELEKKLNLTDACTLLDEEAPLFLDNSAFDKDFSDRVLDLK
jgi:hypothetical protein